MLAGEVWLPHPSMPVTESSQMGACFQGWPLSCGAGLAGDVVCWPSLLVEGIGRFSDAGHVTCPSSCPPPLKWVKWVNPLVNACHVTTVLVVTTGRSLFSSTSWHHPHPSVTQNVAQPAASCLNALVAVIG